MVNPKRIASFVFLILLTLGLAAPLAAKSGYKQPQTKAQKSANKQWKSYSKKQAKQQKKQLKAQQKQMKKYNKEHPPISVT